MFSGIIQAIGKIAELQPLGGDVRLLVDVGEFDVASIAPGDSIAVSGVCLTVVEIVASQLAFDVSNETLSCTALGALRQGGGVNLEKALRLVDRLDGHLVSGHVDGVGRVIAIEADARSQRWTFEVPPELAKYIAGKGSVCVDGTSLTVNETDEARFGVNLIPHTIEVTTFKHKRVGDAVNIEVDLIARYVEKLLQPSSLAAKKPPASLADLSAKAAPGPDGPYF
jgi:riboflavin synthase